MRRATEIISAGDKLKIAGVELPGRCEDYSVDSDQMNPYLRVTVTLLIPRVTISPDPVLADPAPIVDDGLRHWAMNRRVAADKPRTTPSGKTACETCGEAWPCSTFGRRGEWPPEVDRSSGAPLD